MQAAEPPDFQSLGVIIVMAMGFYIAALLARILLDEAITNRQLKFVPCVQFYFPGFILHCVQKFSLAILSQASLTFVGLSHFVSKFLCLNCLRIMDTLLAKARVAALLTGRNIEFFNRTNCFAMETPPIWSLRLLPWFLAVFRLLILSRLSTTSHTPFDHLSVGFGLRAKVINRKTVLAFFACYLVHNYNHTNNRASSQA